MKLCKDCRWLSRNASVGDDWKRCEHPAATKMSEPNPVNGKVEEITTVARVMRDGDHACGPNATLFEAGGAQ